MTNKVRSLFPGEGSISSAANKRFEEVIVFVPFFGGTKLHMRRHADMVNALGFDALTFNLSFDKKLWIKRLPISRGHEFGLRYLWADEVEDILNAVPGPKILYAFSNPAACAIAAIARRKAKDVRALICDSGPFVNMPRCGWNLLTHEYVVPSRLLRLPATVGLSFLWGIEHTKHLRKDLASLPKNFPVLSIRGWEDPLVPVYAIDGAFEHVNNHLNYETLALPKAGHLNGLKDFESDYVPKVAKFLQKRWQPTFCSELR